MDGPTLITSAGLESMLRRVQGLLRQADHPNTGPTEAATFRAKAEALMLKYRIDEATVVVGSHGSIKPKWTTIDVCSGNSEYRYYYTHLIKSVISHVGVRGVTEHVLDSKDELRQYVLRCNFVGFESDVHLVDILYTSCMIAFQNRLEPRYDPELSDQLNAYNMRRAGMEGWRIAKALWGSREDKLLYKARKLFKLEALERGEDPNELLGQGNNMRIYRESYAHGFVSHLDSRLYQMRVSRAADATGLVLASREDAINEAFYERYPQYAPPKPLPAGPEQKAEEQGSDGVGRNHERGTYTDPRATCQKCQKAKSGYCRDHSYLRPSTAGSYRAPYSSAGLARGREAARQVDLGPGGRKSLQ